mmetsp:Transcript_31369/g.65019  ORF Transcript_31369/g.65019 Transcript_31369/m.65019 type:complete len:368 (+) Transcript_31369:3015-4118(+)
MIRRTSQEPPFVAIAAIGSALGTRPSFETDARPSSPLLPQLRRRRRRSCRRLPSLSDGDSPSSLPTSFLGRLRVFPQLFENDVVAASSSRKINVRILQLKDHGARHGLRPRFVRLDGPILLLFRRARRRRPTRTKQMLFLQTQTGEFALPPLFDARSADRGEKALVVSNDGAEFGAGSEDGIGLGFEGLDSLVYGVFFFVVDGVCVVLVVLVVVASFFLFFLFLFFLLFFFFVIFFLLLFDTSPSSSSYFVGIVVVAHAIVGMFPLLFCLCAIVVFVVMVLILYLLLLLLLLLRGRCRNCSLGRTMSVLYPSAASSSCCSSSAASSLFAFPLPSSFPFFFFFFFFRSTPSAPKASEFKRRVKASKLH